MVTVAALVYGLVVWINSSGLIEPAWPPTPVEINHTNLPGMAADLERCYQLGNVPSPTRIEYYRMAYAMDAFYCADRITISWRVDLETPQGQTALVHELVHWLQDYNGARERVECLEQLEQDAYRVHWEWQRQIGIPQAPDEETARQLSQCP